MLSARVAIPTRDGARLGMDSTFGVPIERKVGTKINRSEISARKSTESSPIVGQCVFSTSNLGGFFISTFRITTICSKMKMGLSLSMFRASFSFILEVAINCNQFFFLELLGLTMISAPLTG